MKIFNLNLVLKGFGITYFRPIAILCHAKNSICIIETLQTLWYKDGISTVDPVWWTFLCSSENSVQGISHSDSLVSREHLILFEKVTLQGQPVLLLRLNSCSTFFNCPSFSARAIKSVFRLPTLNSGMCQNISFNIQNPWEQKHVFINKSLVNWNFWNQ